MHTRMKTMHGTFFWLKRSWIEGRLRKKTIRIFQKALLTKTMLEAFQYGLNRTKSQEANVFNHTSTQANHATTHSQHGMRLQNAKFSKHLKSGQSLGNKI